MQPTSNREYLWRPDGRAEAAAKLKEAKEKKGISYKALAEKIGVSKAWLACAIDGQQWVPQEYADKIAHELGVSAEDVAYMTEHPYKGYADPILYRLHEVFDTYGPALKELIHEEFGNAIMSAIDFKVDVERRPDPKGDRIIITFDGKCLPYSLAGKYPW
ncbi:MAG: cyanase [Anaerolineae bacterium]|nr:cyanase [Anaerolineae bacterium]